MSYDYDINKLKDEADKYVGLTLEEADKRLLIENKTRRIMTLDNEHFCGTCDWVTSRVNFRVVNNIVTDAWVG